MSETLELFQLRITIMLSWQIIVHLTFMLWFLCFTVT